MMRLNIFRCVLPCASDAPDTTSPTQHVWHNTSDAARHTHLPHEANTPLPIYFFANKSLLSFFSLREEISFCIRSLIRNSGHYLSLTLHRRELFINFRCQPIEIYLTVTLLLVHPVFLSGLDNLMRSVSTCWACIISNKWWDCASTKLCIKKGNALKSIYLIIISCTD